MKKHGTEHEAHQLHVLGEAADQVAGACPVVPGHRQTADVGHELVLELLFHVAGSADQRHAAGVPEQGLEQGQARLD